MAFANTPVEYYKWVAKHGGITMYAGDSKEDASAKVQAILNNPQTTVKEMSVYRSGRKVFKFERMDTGKWKATELKPFKEV